jgi:hypothetical protein
LGRVVEKSAAHASGGQLGAHDSLCSGSAEAVSECNDRTGGQPTLETGIGIRSAVESPQLALCLLGGGFGMSQTNRTSQFVGLESNNFLGLARTYNIAKIVNGGIDFGSSTQLAQGPGSAYTGNMNGQWVNVTAPSSANTEFAIPHNLNRIPSFYFYNSNVAAIVYELPNTGTAWTTSNIYVKCNTASAILRMFIT